MLDGAPFKTLTEFSAWQKGKVQEHLEQGGSYTAPHATLTVIHQHTETPLTEGPVTMTAAELRCGDTAFPMDEIYDLAMHGQRTVVFTAGKTYYELIVDEHINTLKFFLFYNACKQQIPEKV